MTVYCKEFILFISTNWANFKIEDILLLFFGNRQYDGLASYIAKLEVNSLGAVSCLDLLCKCLDSEINPQFELYSYAFKLGPISAIQEMNIISYFKYGKYDCVNKAFKLIQIWISKNSENNLSKKLEEILIDDILIKMFTNSILN